MFCVHIELELSLDFFYPIVSLSFINHWKNLEVLSSRDGVMLVCLCFSDGGFEEETQRGAGERGGESQEAKQRGAWLTDFASPTAVSNFKSGSASITEMDTGHPGNTDKVVAWHRIHQETLLICSNIITSWFNKILYVVIITEIKTYKELVRWPLSCVSLQSVLPWK